MCSANITDADLGGADLSNADLTEAKMAGTDISVAETNNTILEHINWGKCERKQENTTHHWVSWSG